MNYQPRSEIKTRHTYLGTIARAVLMALMFTGAASAVSAQGTSSSYFPIPGDRYYIRVSGCDDGGKAYINGTLVVDVGFDEDSNWLDITEDLRKGRNRIRFEVKNRTGAITYVWQIKKNDSIIFERACGTVKVIGCENNRAFRVGIARSVTYLLTTDK